MRCPSCQSENPNDATFCEQCGARLEIVCPNCRAPLSHGARFCKKCGTRLDERAAAPAALATSPRGSEILIAPEATISQAADGERKTVTALFADIKGSMELMEDLDPEEARAIVDPALRLMIDAVHRYDGYIVQSTGDGIFALFGAPVAHEDDPQRALYVALRMQEELRRYSERLRMQDRQPLQVRVGVNTGEVVVRSIQTQDGQAEYTPIGHSTGLAARMQALAPIGSIAATQHTQRLCEGYFTFKSLGAATIKGVKDPVNVFEVTGLGPLRTRLQVAARRGLTKFVGRQTELEQMKHALELARAGHGQIVAAIGEPGVGKTRLFLEFKAIAQSTCLVLEAYSVSHGKASAYLPVIDLLKGYFEILNEDDERKRCEKVTGKVLALERSLEDTLPYLFALLDIRQEGEDSLGQLDPQTRRRRTLEAIKRILACESLNQPLMVIFEDLHWIDEQTQEFLNLVADSIGTAKILLLVNYRPEYSHQWNSKTYYTQLRLDPLGRESAEQMLSGLLGEGGELAPLRRLIIGKTEGNPFFMEEMVQALFEQGVLVRDAVVKLAKPLDEIRVPPTVQAILASRIDRLPAAEKDLLQSLAVLGREFSLALIKGVAVKSDTELEPLLSALQLAEFIYEQPAIPDIEYTFKHALTQEVAYNSVLAERRRLLHERAAQVIEVLFNSRLDDHLTELAYHYDCCRNIGRAVEYLGRAGRRAVQQSAHSEAVARLTRALDLMGELPDSFDSVRQELDILMALSWSLYITKGPLAPERERVVLRAQALCERLGDKSKLAEALLGLSLFRFNQRQFGPAQEIAERILVLAKQIEAPALLAGAHSILGAIMTVRGQLEAGRGHLECAAEFFGRGPFDDFGNLLFAQIAANQLVSTLSLLGYPETALRESREFLTAARKVGDPVSIAYALFRNTVLHAWLRSSPVVLELTDELLSMGIERGMEWLQAGATVFRGHAIASEGQAEEGVAQMRKGISGWFATAGRGGVLPVALGLLAEGLCRTGNRAEGLVAITDAFSSVPEIGRSREEAELHRVKGELMLMNPPDEAGAERCFRAAIEIARNQSARWWELRARVSLARLLKRQGRTAEARNQLSKIYNWFTEGFEFADLKDAKALLEELGA